ncbi:TIGR04438 family Trp-rich protein [Ramlibacter albus]|uniref:TIGR04438 family Trp-rich protein n=1 Tax=Ramlibacter albus TaxID=2079448 RepID=A0A923MDE7_9BURK|nr:TIGR04438 family Trp-rich protein [Ramlibacter albus]MBC5768318.1 TIGR04438 family Trp-rich protein [Ramlibacter albus]
MLFLLIGIGLLIAKTMEIGQIATWPWWVVLSPFGLAVAWWAWADASGFTKRKAMQREEERKQARIDKNRENIGMAPKKKR